MKNKIIILFSCLFLLLMTSPALGDVNLNINGKSFTPQNPPQLEEGITIVPLYVISRTLGADVAVDDSNNITIKENDNTMQITVNSNIATFNGQNLVMPKKVEIIDDEIMVPLRFIYETFSVNVDWQGKDQTVLIDYKEERNEMTAEELLTVSTDKQLKLNTYKMKVNNNMLMKMNAPGEDPLEMDITTIMDGAVKIDPVCMYMKQTVKNNAINSATSANEIVDGMKSESFINNDGFYMTMPEQGWVKMDMPGLDMAALMEQAGSQDPVKSIQQMKDCGVIISYANDQEKDGHEYWVVNVTMGKESFQKYINDMAAQIPAIDSSSTSTEDPQEVMSQLFKNMKADMVYNVWIDKESLLTSFMDLDSTIEMNMTVPAEEGTASDITINMDLDASYELYDFGKSFSSPDVSQAISMNEYMEKQMQNIEKSENTPDR